MLKHKALIIGAGRIGAGFDWSDDAYTHAGAYKALTDRVDLLGFVEPDPERAGAAKRKWLLPAYDDLADALGYVKPDVVSICTGPDDRAEILSLVDACPSVKGIWCEKPWRGSYPRQPVQVNYLRRADPDHRYIANIKSASILVVYGKDDETTKCHFLDLAKFWSCKLDYRPFNGPCAYIFLGAGTRFFDNGGIDAGACMKGMLENLLDHLDKGTPLYSPAFERAGS